MTQFSTVIGLLPFNCMNFSRIRLVIRLVIKLVIANIIAVMLP